MRVPLLAGIVVIALAAGCSRDASSPKGDAAAAHTPIVTISADQAVSPVPAWRVPAVQVTDENVAELKEQAAQALSRGRLFGGTDDAIPLYYALRRFDPEDAAANAGFDRSLKKLIASGDDALKQLDRDPLSLRRAHEIAAVARAVAPANVDIVDYLARLDRADEAQEANRLGEEALNAGRLGVDGETGHALTHFREALQLRPDDMRANQGIAAVESALIRRAEQASDRDDYAAAERELDIAAKVRPKASSVEDARGRLAMQRIVRINALRDAGLTALMRQGGIDEARRHLAVMLRIAPTGDPATRELRERIDLATHYGLFRPAQVFTDAMQGGGRGPQMVVIPHGAFRMGSEDNEGQESERPARNIRFDRGFAMSRTEITVGEFRRFMQATKHRARASRRGYSTAYDERSGNLVRRGNVDWQSDYVGQPARDDMPVIHVSAKDAMAYAEWLSAQTGQRYRLPSEAEFEYALRAGSRGRYPWGEGAPPARTGNFTGGADVSPSGRRWRNAFPGYGDGAWGPAPVATYRPNVWGLHDMAGNVSEWVADCWHDTFRRAPRGGEAWINPGCRSRVVRGGSWASAPEELRSAWRQGSDANNTTARIGFRVVRDI
ncbi:formylglycine-generating enzyme family protein [Lysobacter auxotrophicus]|uniref:SUMF1/EgtB/PvdO family nonheme iron enzyme n=1 Tax=Lysobacter auxotrophicus TaxID=2992573 RepID=A0ABM8DF01_9GAMM|nr:formylglycine-generating enzyme family protein [Lysobacter auxotrophicus]BDU17181.1 SUMF1/EgtB/PvdO family nonheme iron enzyme [Lysobacter auxotrophicus]